MASVEEVKVNLGVSVDQTQRAVTALLGAADQLDEALSRLRLTVIGSVHPSIVDAIARLEQARARLDEAQALARSAIDSADSYRMVV